MRAWQDTARGVMRRPLLSALGAATLLIVLSLPALSMVTANRSLEQLPASTDVRIGNEVLTKQITGPGQGRTTRSARTVVDRGPATC